MTKAKTERIKKEALYNQMKAAEGTGATRFAPAVLSNDYIQKLEVELADLQRQQAQLAERYGPRHPEMIKINTAIQSADAKLQGRDREDRRVGEERLPDGAVAGTRASSRRSTRRRAKRSA